MAKGKEWRAKRLHRALQGLEELEEVEFARHEQRIVEIMNARDQALSSLSGESVLGGVFINLIAKQLRNLDRELDALKREQEVRRLNLNAAHRRTEGADKLVKATQAAAAQAEERRDLESLLERAALLPAQGPRKMSKPE